MCKYAGNLQAGFHSAIEACCATEEWLQPDEGFDRQVGTALQRRIAGDAPDTVAQREQTFGIGAQAAQMLPGSLHPSLQAVIHRIQVHDKAAQPQSGRGFGGQRNVATLAPQGDEGPPLCGVRQEAVGAGRQEEDAHVVGGVPLPVQGQSGEGWVEKIMVRK